MKIALALALAAVVMLTAGPASAQKKKKGSDQTRSVQGVVTGPDDKGVEGAIVQLKNTKTLQIRSFLTQPDGTYVFPRFEPRYRLRNQRPDHGCRQWNQNSQRFRHSQGSDHELTGESYQEVAGRVTDPGRLPGGFHRSLTFRGLYWGCAQELILAGIAAGAIAGRARPGSRSR